MKMIYKVTIAWLLCNILIKFYGNLQWYSLIPDYLPMQSFWLFADISVIAANLFAAYVLIQEKLHTTLTVFLFIGVALNICGSLLVPARQNLPEELYWLSTNLLVAATSIAVALLLVKNRGHAYADKQLK